MNALEIFKRPVSSILTGHTCGPNCWEAREAVCRCECGGKNHGVLCESDGIRPARRCKIDGESYTLRGVAKHSHYQAAKAINEQDGPYRVDPCTGHDGKVHIYRYWWKETDSGAPCRVKPATRDQVAKWPELTAFQNIERYERAYLLWLKDGVVLTAENEAFLESGKVAR